MHENTTISVIVPVYNTEKYLNACIASIVHQTHSALQIILIDDGSSDRSCEICNEWAKKDNRIQVIHQENNGVSAARNAGLQIATGEWISFVDSDDILHLEAYEQLLGSWNQRELIMGRIGFMREDGILMQNNPAYPPSGLSPSDFIIELFEEEYGYYLGYLLDKLFKKSIIQNNHICFDSDIKVNEDRLFLLEYLLHCSCISVCGALVYYYRQRSTGVIMSTRHNQTVTDSEMTVIDSFHHMAVIAKTYSNELYYIVARKSFECSLDLRCRIDQKDRKKIKQIRQFMRENVRISLHSPNIGVIKKLKMIGHCIFEH